MSRKERGHFSARARILAAVVACAYAVFVGTVTLTSKPYGDDVAGVIDGVLDTFSRSTWTSWVTFDRVEFVANIGMFVPLGLSATVAMGRHWWWAVTCVLMAYSIGIETWQLVVFPATRVASLADVGANSLGALVGAVGACALQGNGRGRASPHLITY